MNSCLSCPFCKLDGHYQQATDVAQVPAIVRAYQEQKFTVWRCANCGSLHSKEDVNLAQFYAGYPFAKQQLDFWSRISFRKRVRLLQKQGLRKDASILDFGCGGGVFVSFLRDQGYSDVVGYDPFVERFADPSLIARSYDAVLAQDVLEHDDDPAAMLVELLRCLKPGGLLYLGTPLANGIRLNDPAAFAVSLHQPYHRHIFSLKALLALTEAQGLKPTGLSKRHCTDTLTPTVNTRFLHEFIRVCGNVVDVGFEPPPKDLFQRHPRLLLLAFFGYFFSHKSELSGFFRRTVPTS